MRALEDEPLLNAGTGAYLQADGVARLDASLMASDGRAGAVAQVPLLPHPVSLARYLLEQDAHVMLAGPEALALAARLGHDVGVVATPAKIAYWQEHLDDACRRLDYAAMAAAWKAENPRLGTVGCVALDAAGRASPPATSTGGTGQCYPGRVGDTPVIGAGTYCTPRVGVSMTGVGERILVKLAAKRLADLVGDGRPARRGRRAGCSTRSGPGRASSPSTRGGEVAELRNTPFMATRAGGLVERGAPWSSTGSSAPAARRASTSSSRSGSTRRRSPLLRAELQGRTPTLAERLRLADLLVLADRGSEAAADPARRGGRAGPLRLLRRALEALRRADAIAPGHADVRQRFEALARAARARIAAAESASRKPEEKTDPYVDPVPRREGPRRRSGKDALPLDKELLASCAGSATAPAGRGARRSRGAALRRPPALRSSAASRTASTVASCPPGGIVVSEGDPGDSIFLIASGSVRILVVGGHGRPLEIRRLDAGDFFGEVAALSGRPALGHGRRHHGLRAPRDRPLGARAPRRGAARRASASSRAPARAARRAPRRRRSGRSPGRRARERAAAVLAAHFGGTSWSPRVRLHFAKLMLDAGQENDALAVIASVAEEMAQGGHAETGIAILKKVDQIRKHEAGAAVPRVSKAASEAAFRVWVGSLAQSAEALMRAAAPPAEEEGADRDGHR